MSAAALAPARVAVHVAADVSDTKRSVQASVMRPAPVASVKTPSALLYYADGHLGQRTAEQLERVQILAAAELETFA